jgi:BirA family biotin operon repressor/biotin-[acetyl-CoA-carboxylase] ligase
VKWPNDVWIHGKKLCGILLDSSTLGSQIWVSLGVGINVNQSMNSDDVPSDIRNVATSLTDHLQRTVDREAFLARFCSNLADIFLRNDMREILKMYAEYDILCGKKVIVMPKGVEDPLRQVAEAIEFTEDGSLRVRFEDGQVKELYAEEVTIRPASL